MHDILLFFSTKYAILEAKLVWHWPIACLHWDSANLGLMHQILWTNVHKSAHIMLF